MALADLYPNNYPARQNIVGSSPSSKGATPEEQKSLLKYQLGATPEEQESLLKYQLGATPEEQESLLKYNRQSVMDSAGGSTVANSLGHMQLNMRPAYASSDMVFMPSPNGNAADAIGHGTWITKSDAEERKRNLLKNLGM